MNKVSYYPGCALKTRAGALEASAIVSMRALGVELVELPQWNCCGVVASLADDDLIHHLAPVRNLVRAQEQGSGTLVTLCSMCYNTLASANLLVKEDKGKRETINLFMDEEPDYAGGVEVAHLLGFLRDQVGWQRVRDQVKVSLNGMKVVPYYGCTLHRPREVGIEPLGSLDAMTGLLEALGADVPWFSAATQCCGSYQVVANPQAAGDAVKAILASAAEAGAERIALSCPLCEFNLKKFQSDLARDKCPGAGIPIIYFSQLMAVGFGEWSPEDL